MNISTTVVTNISTQALKVLYSEIAPDSSVSTIAHNSAGELVIAPGGKIIIETSRLDAGQLQAFYRKKLITFLELTGPQAPTTTTTTSAGQPVYAGKNIATAPTAGIVRALTDFPGIVTTTALRTYSISATLGGQYIYVVFPAPDSFGTGSFATPNTWTWTVTGGSPTSLSLATSEDDDAFSNSDTEEQNYATVTLTLNGTDVTYRAYRSHDTIADGGILTLSVGSGPGPIG